MRVYSHQVGRRRGRMLFGTGLLVLVAGCSSGQHDRQSSPAASATAPSSAHATRLVHRMVVLGDTIADDRTYTCVRCTTFPDQLARALSRAVGGDVEVHNLTIPDAQVSDLLHSVRTDEVDRSVISGADAIVVTIGHNDLAYNRRDDPCGAAPRYPRISWQRITHRCIDRATAQYRSDLDAVLTDVERLRNGRPTMIRLTTVYNSVIGDRVDPSWNLLAAIEPSTYAVQHMVRAQCAIAEGHHGLCADTYHRLNGNTGLRSAQPFLNPADATHLAASGEDTVAAALIALAYAPLTAAK